MTCAPFWASLDSAGAAAEALELVYLVGLDLPEVVAR